MYETAATCGSKPNKDKICH